MIKCIAKCSKGFDRCCFNCQLKEICKDSCTRTSNKKKPEDCKWHVHSEEVRAENRTRETAKRFWRLYIILFLLTAAVLIFGFCIIGNQNALMVMNTDILNQQNTIITELDKQSIDTSTEDRSQEELELCSKEFDLVCRVVAAEARGEDLQGMMAVAQTIRDRSELWGMTPTEVVQSPSQYAEPFQGEISDDIRLAVANVFNGGVRVFDEPITHFAQGEPYWAENKVNRGSIGRHTFWY